MEHVCHVNDDSGGETMAALTAGITFRETMEGWFSLNEEDPRKGQEKGHRAHTRLTITPIVTIESLDRMQFDKDHTGTLESSIRFAPLFGADEPVGSKGTFKLFAPAGNTKLKLMIYEFGFGYQQQQYYFYGQKGVENDCGGLDIWKDTTTLFSKLYKGNNRLAPVIGAGVLRITIPGFLKQLSTMRVTNTPSGPEKLGAYLTFANFFAGQLWDTYMKR
jgi:hypothetical protein